MAEVTRKHRELAFAAMWADPGPHEYVDRFIRTGLDTATPPIYPITARIAQALADIEAEALAQVSALRAGAPGRLAHALDDTRGFHVETLPDEVRASFLHRLANAAFDPNSPTSWNPVPREQPSPTETE